MCHISRAEAHEIVKAFRKLGYEPDHQSGSHVIIRNKEQPHRRLSIPNHNELAKGTLKKIINEAGLTREEFVDLF